MSAPSPTLLQYLRIFSQNFALFVRTSVPAFCCPTCDELIALDGVGNRSNWQIDKSHVFPKAAGGNRFTIECRKCNNDMNAAGDNELVNAMQLHSAFKPCIQRGRLFTLLRTRDREIEVEVMRTGRIPHIQARGRDNTDENRKSIKDAISEGARFTVGQNLDNQKVLFGYLHSAHLVLFATFGYGYTSSPTGRWIKEILMSRQLASGALIVLNINSGRLDRNEATYQVGAYTKDGPADVIGVTLPDYSGNFLAKMVLVPVPLADGASHYDEIRQSPTQYLDAAEFRAFHTRRRRLSAVEHAFDFYTLTAGIGRRGCDQHSFVLAVARTANLSTVTDVDCLPILNRLGYPDDFALSDIPHLIDVNMLNSLPPPYRNTVVRLSEKAVTTILGNPFATRIIEFSSETPLIDRHDVLLRRTTPDT